MRQLLDLTHSLWGEEVTSRENATLTGLIAAGGKPDEDHVPARDQLDELLTTERDPAAEAALLAELNVERW